MVYSIANKFSLITRVFTKLTKCRFSTNTSFYVYVEKFRFAWACDLQFRFTQYTFLEHQVRNDNKTNNNGKNNNVQTQFSFEVF